MGNLSSRRAKIYEVEISQNQKPGTPRKSAAVNRRLSDVIPDTAQTSTVKKSNSNIDIPAKDLSYITGENPPPSKKSSISSNGQTTNGYTGTQALKPKLISIKEVRQVTTNFLKKRIYGLDKSPRGFAESLFPQPTLFFNYRPLWLCYDLLSGILVAMIHFTQEFATAMTASMRPTMGLYISIFPPLIYAIFATSPHNSLGAMPITAAVTAVSVMNIQETYYEQKNDPLGYTDQLSPDFTWNLHFRISLGLAFYAGVFLILWGVLKMGFLVTIISPSVMDPFGLACMLQSIAAQIPTALGITLPVRFTYAKHWRDVVFFITHITSVNGGEAIISISFATVILVFREYLQPVIYRKIKLVIPIEFLMFILVIGLSYSLRIQERYQVRTIGHFSYGLPWPSVPPLTEFGLHIVWHGFFCAVIAYTVTLGSARTLARKNKDNIKTNQELIALGLAHLFGSFFSSFIVAAPMGRGIINQSMGSRSQLSTVCSSIFLGILVAFAGPAIAYLPQCIISTTIVLFLVFSLKGFAELPKLWRANKFDAFIWVSTFISSISLTVQIGFLLGICLSVVGLIIRTQSPKVRILGRLKNSSGFVPLKYYNKAEEIAGIRILQIICPLHYANAHYLVQDILSLAMEPYVGKSDISNESNLYNETGDSLRSFLGTTTPNPPKSQSKNRSDTAEIDVNSNVPGRVRFTPKASGPTDFRPFKPPAATTRISNEFILIAGTSTTKASRVILDLGTVGYIDAVGIRGLEQLASDLKVKAIELMLAQCKGPLRKQLRELEAGKVIPERNIFPSLVEAVNESSRRIRIKTSEAQGTIRDRERRDVRFWDFPIANRVAGLPQINYRKD